MKNHKSCRRCAGPSRCPSPSPPPQTTAARIFSTIVQDVPPDGELRALSFEGARFDTRSLYDAANPTRLTAPVAGIYQITANVLFEPNPQGTPNNQPLGNRGVVLRLNGTTYIGGQFGTSAVGEGGPTAIIATTLYSLAAGDYVEAMVNQTLSTPITAVVQPNAAPEFMMARIG